MIDNEWIRTQLILSGWDPSEGGSKQSVYNSVMMLVRELNTQNHVDEKLKLTVVSLFSKLASGEVIAPLNLQGEVRWIPLELGAVKLQDTVRVKPNAYSDERFSIHNGKVGKVSRVSNGEVYVHYLGDDTGTGQNHKPDKLEIAIL